MVTHIARVWINRVRLPILHVFRKWKFPCPRLRLRIWSRETGSAVPQPVHPHTQAESGAYLRDSSRVPRRRPFIYFKPPYAIGSVPSSFIFHLFFFNLTYSRWTSSLPSCLWSQRIFPSLPGSRLTIFYRDASSALLQLVNQWLNFTYSRSHAFRYERKNTNPTLVRIELTTSALAGVQVTY